MLVEVARIVRHGGRLVFIAFELDAQRIAVLLLWKDPVADYRPILARAGFEVLRYEQIPNWQDQVAAGFGAVVAQRDATAATSWRSEYGPDRASSLLSFSARWRGQPLERRAAACGDRPAKPGSG
jgi:hypothetical protein